MSKLLFALENEMEGYEEGEGMTVMPEEGEMADTEMEMMPEEGEVMDTSYAIGEGMEASDQLEEVEEVMEHSMEEGEGMDPVAAECLRIAVEAIAIRVGYNAKNIYSLYATENFSSTSSRRANTKIALEGVGEFLSNLWEKIKAAVKSVWDKVAAFWNKHLSSIARAKSALESMKKKINKIGSKTPKESSFDKAPGGLAKAFAGQDTINKTLISDYITVHSGEITALKAVNSASIETTMLSIMATAKSHKGDIDEFKESVGTLLENKYKSDVSDTAASEKTYFIGGQYKHTEYTSGGFKVKFEDMEDKGTGGDRGIDVGSKTDLTSLINETLAVINSTIKFRDTINKSQTDIKKGLDMFGTNIDTKETAKDATPEIKKKEKYVLTVYGKLSTFRAVEFTKVLSLNVKLASAVIKYTAFSISKYSSK